VGARTDAARAEVLAAREGLAEATIRLEAAGRAAVDIPARIRREPAKVLGAAGGAAFLLLGGPRRVLGGVRRAVFGPPSPMPKSLLPKEVEKAVRSLGEDGEAVRRTLERAFADYLDDKAPQRREAQLSATAATLVSNVLKPVSKRLGTTLAERAFDPDAMSFAEGLRQARARRGEAAPDDQSSRLR
jgi:hypothetical protein